MMRLLALLATLLAAAVGSPAAVAQGTDGDRGRDLLSAVETGERDCDELDRVDFAAIGEYLMERMAGGRAAHGAMDEVMRSMMGGRDELAAHEQMGRRLAGCGGGAFTGMMSMMMGGGGSAMMGGGDGPGMTRIPGGRPYPPGSRELAGDDGDWHGEDTAMVALMALLLLVGGGAIWVFRPRGGAARAETPLEVLARRLAAGEIDPEDYERRRQALGGTV